MNAEHADIDAQLSRLQERVEALASRCEQLRDENLTLKARFEDWSKERAQLVEKTAIAKNRVEAMTARLKSMGQES